MTAYNTRSSVVAGAVSVEGLGFLVEEEISRVDGLLFTATPRSDLDELGRIQRLKDAAFAAQLRVIVAMLVRMPAAHREFASDELALACNVGMGTASMLLSLAVEAAELPGLIEAVESGRWTERHLRAVLDELARYPLTLQQRQAVVLITLARYVDETPGELRAVLRRIIARVDREAAAGRKKTADRHRSVHLGAGADGQGSLYAIGPLEKLAEIGAALDQALAAENLPADDTRSVDERRFDALHRLITGGSQAGAWVAHVLVPYSVLEGGELELAEVPGLGPILPSTAADLAAQAQALTQLAVDDVTGQVLGVSDLHPGPAAEQAETAQPEPAQPEPAQPVPDAAAAQAWARLLRAALYTDPAGSSYRPNPRLRRLLEARDRTCTFPGCGRPASQTDKDHRIPWPLGPTDRTNTHCLCRHHHRAKQATFTVTVDAAGNTVWTQRGGWTFLRRPKGY